jgi:Carboxypeptidase regulatory-like domain
MKVRAIAVLAVLVLLAGALPARAQVQTGEITGRVTDDTGALLPGVTVTLTSPVLIQPQSAATSETGTYRFTLIPIGTYIVKFELPGFKTVVRDGISVTIGFTAQVNQQLAISTVQETVTVSGESPVVDTKNTGAKTTFDLESLQSIPSARDPWVMLERAPAITMDRANVGGSQSGQQSTFISRGAAGGNNKWSIDGVDITDMSATGASPMYYDFDMLQEMQVTTGGADASQQTGGVGINLVTRSGTDRFKGSGRWFVTDEEFEANNVDDELRAQGAGSGNPIQNIKDIGLEVGGPIKRGKLWYWGSYGTQDIKVGVLGFFKPTPTCRVAPTSSEIIKKLDTATLRSCLETDLTTLNNYNVKLQWVPFRNNKMTFQNTWAEKVRNARDASDTRPIETTYRQKSVPTTYAGVGWNGGANPLWKIGDQHVLTDRLLLDVTWAHHGNNFALDFHDDSLTTVQPRVETTTNAFSRSFDQSVFVRPTQSFDVTTSYFLPATLGGDHAFKVGFKWRDAPTTSVSHTGGNAIVRYTNSVPNSVDLYRDGDVRYDLQTYAVFVQDSFTVDRLTLNLGVRWDRQDDQQFASSVAANPIAPDWLPALTFPGGDPGVVWNTYSPRIGMTYDLRGTGKTIARSSYSLYYGQLAPGQLAQRTSAVSQVFVRFPWNDLNGDAFAQREEITFGIANILSRSAAYNPNDPTNFRSAGSVDQNIKDDRTFEFIAGLDHELLPRLAIGGAYIWRKYDRFFWSDNIGLTSADYRAVAQTPTCPVAGARCEPVTYFEPTIPIPAAFVYTNIPDRWRNYNGVELTLTKRYADRWMASLSYAYNNAVDVFDSPDSYQDPTCTAAACPGKQQYAPESGGSGIDNVFPNAKWLIKANGLYTLPWQEIGLSANLNSRQGYPFPQSIQTPNRANQAGQAQVSLDLLGELRMDNVTSVDFRVDKTFTFARGLRIVPSVDVFNLMNANTILARRRNQIAANANEVSGIIAPRVVRFGVKVNW